MQDLARELVFDDVRLQGDRLALDRRPERRPQLRGLQRRDPRLERAAHGQLDP